MKGFLEKLESQLKNLIEGSVQLFPWNSTDKTIVIAIIHQLRNQIYSIINNGEKIPNVFSISVHPQIYENIGIDQSWVQEIKNSLIESAEDFDQIISGDININFLSDPKIKNLNDFKIDSYFSPADIEKTAVMKLSSKENANEKIKLEAYLLLPNQDTFPLSGTIIHIGRKKDNQLIIDNPSVSRNHAQIRFINGNFVIFDLNSTSGTFVNGIQIHQALLRAGDVISIANYPMVYGEESDSNDLQQGSTAEIPKIVGF